jgi:hypothetical protein
MKNFLHGLIFVALLILTSCGSPETSTSSLPTNQSNDQFNFDTRVNIFFSVDDGRVYTSGVRVLPVNKTVFMKIFIEVAYNNASNTLVGAEVILPNVEGIEAFYNSGQVLSPDQDLVNNLIIYKPQFIAKQVPDEYVLTFKFIPLKAGNQKIRIIFDEKILPTEDYEDTISFVE